MNFPDILYVRTFDTLIPWRTIKLKEISDANTCYLISIYTVFEKESIYN